MARETQSVRENVLDYMVKYSALLVATGYVCGFMEQVGELTKFKGETSFFSFDFSSNVLALGLLIAFQFVFLPLWLLWLELIFGLGGRALAAISNFRRPGQPNRAALFHHRFLVPNIVVKCVFFLAAVYLLIQSVGWRDWEMLAFVLIGDLVLVILIVRPSWIADLSKAIQAGLAVLTLALMFLFSVGFGSRMASNRSHKGIPLRLLVSADAVDGLEKLGINFPTRAKDSTCTNSGPALLSESVEVLSVGASRYVLKAKNGNEISIKSESIIAVSK